MSVKRDFIAEIEEIRGRMVATDWDNGITKLLFLCDQMKGLQEETEQQSYFLVASIAAIETYFRWEIRRLVDSGDQRYVNNLRLDDLQIKINHDLAAALNRRRVTIGELVAHSVGLSNLDAINKSMSTLLEADFIELVKEARDPHSRREHGENAPTIIRSAGDTIANVRRAFELRHIICHEAHLNVPAGLAEVKQLCSSCYEFVLASHYGIAFHWNPMAPLTLKEKYKEASTAVQALEKGIKSIEALIALKLDLREKESFDAMQQTWRLYVEREAAFHASLQMNGNRAALYGQLAIAKLFSKRLDELQEYAKTIDRGAPAK